MFLHDDSAYIYIICVCARCVRFSNMESEVEKIVATLIDTNCTSLNEGMLAASLSTKILLALFRFGVATTLTIDFDEFE